VNPSQAALGRVTNSTDARAPIEHVRLATFFQAVIPSPGKHALNGVAEAWVSVAAPAAVLPRLRPFVGSVDTGKLFRLEAAMRTSLRFFAIVLFVLIFFLILFTPSACASSAGIAGYSGMTAGVTCNACHYGGITPTVTLTGPTSVASGSTNQYTLTITGGRRSAVVSMLPPLTARWW